MPFTPFTESEVRRIFELSERGGGHAGARHVSIPNSGLAARLQDHRGTSFAAYTSFLRFADQIAAALDLLNDPAHEAELERFRVQARASDGAATVIAHALKTPVRMRYAIGDGAQTFPCHRVRLVLRKCAGRPRDMHIVSFFGEMG